MVSRPLLVARPSGGPEPAHALQRDSVSEMSSSRQRIPSFEGYSEPPLRVQSARTDYAGNCWEDAMSHAAMPKDTPSTLPV